MGWIMGKLVVWDEVLANSSTFIGGVHDLLVEEGFLYRGQIAAMKGEGDLVIFRFLWRAWSDPSEPEPRWFNCTQLVSAVSRQYAPRDIGESRVNVPAVQGSITLFPKGSLIFDPSAVIDLNLEELE